MRMALKIADLVKDNKRLRNELAAAYGVEQDRFPRLEVPHKAGGSFLTGFSLLNSIYSNAQIRVSPSCVGFIRSNEKWNGDKRLQFNVLDLRPAHTGNVTD